MNEFEPWDKAAAFMQANPQQFIDDSFLLKEREKMMNFLHSNPLLQQYTQHIMTPERVLNTLPWHALGERYFATGLMLEASRNWNIQVNLSAHVPRERLLITAALQVCRATPYLWSDKMEKLADAAPLPKHTISRSVLPHPTMFWSRESCYKIHAVDNQARDIENVIEGENNWAALFYTPKQIVIWGDLVKPETKEMEIVCQTIPFGKTWPDDFDELEVRTYGIVLKRCAFLNSPYIISEPQRLAHHHRRQMEKAGVPKAEVEDRVHVVALRREVNIHPPKEGPKQEGVEWQHQWWVTGHYRAQWYPTEQAHKVIWIAPFLKGPSDKPILEKVYAVIR